MEPKFYPSMMYPRICILESIVFMFGIGGSIGFSPTEFLRFNYLVLKQAGFGDDQEGHLRYKLENSFSLTK